MDVSNLVIEVTRKCNIECAHCLRGDAQPQSITQEVMDKICNSISEIGNLTLTGGEPFLHMSAFELIVNTLVARAIPVESFYIATNGTCFTTRALQSVVKLYSHCYDKSECVLEFSNESYHEEAIGSLCWYGDIYGMLEDAQGLMACLKFVRNKYNQPVTYANVELFETVRTFNKDLLRIGRAEDLPGVPYIENPERTVEDQNELIEGEGIDDVAVTVHGKVYLGCDYSYDWVDENYICDIENIEEYFAKFEDSDK